MISVVIPAFNAGKYIAATLESLLVDVVPELEIVVCDDGSTDDTRDLVSLYATKDNRIKYIRQENRGPGAARNAAFQASSGRSILFFDADDLLHPGSLDAVHRIACDHGDDVIYWSWAKLVDNSDSLRRGPTTMNSDMTGCQWVTRAFLKDYPTYPGCFLLPRSLVEKCGGWDERLSLQDDMEFYSRNLVQAPTMRYCHEGLFIYRDSVANTVSKRQGRKSSESHWLATSLAVDHLLGACDSWQARSGGVRQLMLVSYTQYLAAPDLSMKAERTARGLADGLLWRPWLPGGPARRLLQAMFGWKRALRIHAFLHRLLRNRS